MHPPGGRPWAKVWAQVPWGGMQPAWPRSAGGGWGGVCVTGMGEPLLLGEGAAQRLYPPPRRQPPWHSREVPDRAVTPATGCPQSRGSAPSFLPGDGHRLGRVCAPLRGVVRCPGFPPDEHKDQPR